MVKANNDSVIHTWMKLTFSFHRDVGKHAGTGADAEAGCKGSAEGNASLCITNGLRHQFTLAESEYQV